MILSKLNFGTILECFEAFFSPLLNLMKLKTNECRKKEAGGSNLAQNMICQDLLVIRHCSWLCQESWSKIHRDSIIDLRWWSIHTFASSVICWAGHSIQSINPSIQGFVTTFQQLFFSIQITEITRGIELNFEYLTYPTLGQKSDFCPKMEFV